MLHGLAESLRKRLQGGTPFWASGCKEVDEMPAVDRALCPMSSDRRLDFITSHIIRTNSPGELKPSMRRFASLQCGVGMHGTRSGCWKSQLAQFWAVHGSRMPAQVFQSHSSSYGMLGALPRYKTWISSGWLLGL